MTVVINGTTGIATPEVTVDNSNADGGQVVLKATGYSNWNIDNYSGSLRSYYGSTVATTIDASGNFQMNSGYGSVATAYGCRAWVNFNGTGTVAIRASGNVSSITDNGTGNYTANFTTAMPDSNYSMVCGSNNTTGDTNRPVVAIDHDNSVGNTTVRTVGTYNNNTFVDCSVVTIAVFR